MQRRLTTPSNLSRSSTPSSRGGMDIPVYTSSGESTPLSLVAPLILGLSQGGCLPSTQQLEGWISCSFQKLHDALSYMILKPDMWGDCCICMALSLPAGLVDQSQRSSQVVHSDIHPSKVMIQCWLQLTQAYTTQGPAAIRPSTSPNVGCPPPYTQGLFVTKPSCWNTYHNNRA